MNVCVCTRVGILVLSEYDVSLSGLLVHCWSIVRVELSLLLLQSSLTVSAGPQFRSKCIECCLSVSLFLSLCLSLSFCPYHRLFQGILHLLCRLLSNPRHCRLVSLALPGMHLSAAATAALEEALRACGTLRELDLRCHDLSRPPTADAVLRAVAASSSLQVSDER